MTSESSLLWSLLVLVAGFYMTVLVEAVSTDDATILQKFKNSVQQGPNGLLGSWGSSADPCTWTGVNCTSSRVTSLTLKNGQLQGTVSDIAGLASLPMLKLLTLSGNNFSQGSISSLTWSTTSGSVCHLEYLDLSYNILHGNFTENGFGVCKGLQTLNLTNNELVGSIPAGMYTQLPSIKVIDLSHNSLTGTLPTEINCSSLQVLSLSFNEFSGAIPTGLGWCPQLTQIDLTSNKFTGGLPADLFTGAKLSYLASSQSSVN